MQLLIFYDLDLSHQNVKVFFSKSGCSNELNSQNGTEKMKMLRSEFPSHQSLPHERKVFRTENYRRSHWRCSVEKGILKKFTNFTGKHLKVPFNKVAVLRACNFSKKRLQHRCFPIKFAEVLRTYILKNICERLLLNLCKYPTSFCQFCSSAIWKYV